MSLDEVEEKFNMAQLVLMSTIQSINFESDKKRSAQKGRGRRANKGKTKGDRNIDAFRRL